MDQTNIKLLAIIKGMLDEVIGYYENGKPGHASVVLDDLGLGCRAISASLMLESTSEEIDIIDKQGGVFVQAKFRGCEELGVEVLDAPTD